VTESPNNSPNKVNLQDSAMQSTAISPFQAAGDDVKMEETTTPSPKHITDTELNVLQSCLRRWRTEVESDVRALQDHIHKIRQTIDDMYEEEDLRKCPYLLHAVLVHEGQASAGHYWAYIRNHIHEKWLKFNDISVVDVSWEELQRESAGGSGNASAYCLMYVDGNNTELFATQDGETGHTLLSLDSLALDLKQLVLEDNQKFMKEMEEWDEDQLRKAAGIGYEEVTVASEQRATTTSIVLKQPRQSQCRERELKKDKETLPVKHRDTEYEPLRRNKEQYDGQEQFTVKSSRDVKKLDLSLPEMQPIITERRRVREDQFDKVSHPANYRAQTGTIATVSQSQIVPSSPAGTVEAPPMSPPASSVGLETEHNKLTFERSTLALERVKSIYHKSGAEEALKQAYEDEFQMLQKLADSFDSLSPKQDLRLKSGVIYFLKNTTPAFVIERTIYEQFSYKGLCFDNR
ncbi:ubiquitin carboxyl-terminal hydrolase 28-like, partial [Saccoglossus kowalevskii]|uniref:ubiquitinyl hydrolase 1 n=1 Tax=Saccoglossus kowalevskii TaxID=10224 RepID=A0ABM0MIX4_SACKO